MKNFSKTLLIFVSLFFMSSVAFSVGNMRIAAPKEKPIEKNQTNAKSIAIAPEECVKGPCDKNSPNLGSETYRLINFHNNKIFGQDVEGGTSGSVDGDKLDI